MCALLGDLDLVWHEASELERPGQVRGKMAKFSSWDG